MKKLLHLNFLLLALAPLVACGGRAAGNQTEPAANLADATPDPAAATQDANDTADALAELQATINGADPVDALNEDYSDALPVRSQLALGTIKLENTDRAVTTEQAGTLLTLWQTLQTLENSGTAAEVEINAVLNQLQATMTPEQLGGIAALRLTEDSLADLSFGLNQNEEGGFGGFFNGAPPDFGGDPPAGEVFVAPPAGGFQGGGPAGGGQPGGGFRGGDGAPGGGLGGDALGDDFDPSIIETRQAELAENPGAMLEQMAVNLVIRTLQRKTGEFELGGFGPGGGAFQALMTVLTESTGLDAATVQEEIAAGMSPADFLSAHDADPDAARAKLIQALDALDLGEDTDTAALADELLAGSMSLRPGGNGTGTGDESDSQP